MLRYIRKFNRKYSVYRLVQHPLYWLREAYLTLKYVDECPIFPAFQFKGSLSLRIRKDKGSSIKFSSPLIVQPWLGGSGLTSLLLDQDASLCIDGEFIIGDNVRIYIGTGGKLRIGGKKNEAGSGITANCVVLVQDNLIIGSDCIIAWDTFITDSDWHHIDGKPSTIPTIIGDHVWLGVGSKVLKGANIGVDSIVTSNSVVLQGHYPQKSLISGNPAKVAKTEIASWRR